MWLLVVFGVLSICVWGGGPSCSYRSATSRNGMLTEFVIQEMYSSDGRIFTYPEDFPPAMVSNDSQGQPVVLAESMGLAMRYFVVVNDRKRFDRVWTYVKKHMLSEQGLIAWRYLPDSNQAADSSASIDDLRIARALLEAYEAWGDRELWCEACELGKAILDYEIVQDTPVESVSWKGGVSRSNVVDLSYLDLYAMKLLARYHEGQSEHWAHIHQRSRSLLLQALSEQGLFHDKYDLRSESYFDQENNLINKLLCAVHLAETGDLKSKVIDFVEKEIGESGMLKGRYDSNSGDATVAFDSVAVYALALHFAVLYNREPLIYSLLEILAGFQHQSSDALRGCFGGRTCHIFDNLLVLLALEQGRGIIPFELAAGVKLFD